MIEEAQEVQSEEASRVSQNKRVWDPPGGGRGGAQGFRDAI